MKKLIHLHTDPKFLQATLAYESNDFKNVIIYLGEANDDVLRKLNTLKVDMKSIL